LPERTPKVAREPSKVAKPTSKVARGTMKVPKSTLKVPEPTLKVPEPTFEVPEGTVEVDSGTFATLRARARSGPRQRRDPHRPEPAREQRQERQRAQVQVGHRVRARPDQIGRDRQLHPDEPARVRDVRDPAGAPALRGPRERAERPER